MEKINLKGISEVLSEKELKNVMGGSEGSCFLRCNQDSSDGQNVSDCSRSTAESVCGGNISNAVCVC